MIYTRETRRNAKTVRQAVKTDDRNLVHWPRIVYPTSSWTRSSSNIHTDSGQDGYDLTVPRQSIQTVNDMQDSPFFQSPHARRLLLSKQKNSMWTRPYLVPVFHGLFVHGNLGIGKFPEKLLHFLLLVELKVFVLAQSFFRERIRRLHGRRHRFLEL